MTRPLRRMPTPQGVGAGQTASVNLPLGLTYERLYIAANVNDGANDVDVPVADWGTYFGEIRLLVDGDAKIVIDAADLASLNLFYGQTMKAGTLPLFLSRPWMRTIDGENATAYGTAGGMATFSLEMEVNSGVTVNTLEVYAVQSPGTPFGPHLRIQKFVHTQGVAGEAEISDIPRGAYAMLAMHVNTGNISDVEVHVDQRKVHESDLALRAAHYDVIGRVPQTGFTHLDFLTENRIAEALPMAVQDFRIKPTFTGTGNFTMYAESLQGR